MEAGFMAIGFKGINDQRVSQPARVDAAFRQRGSALGVQDHARSAPGGVRVYYSWLLEKPVGRVEPRP